MPFRVTDASIRKVCSEHLKPGETLEAITLIGARGTLGITNTGRVYQTNYPFFGKSKIIDEYQLTDITSCDSQQKNSYTILLTVIARHDKEYKVTITPFVDSINNVADFIQYVHSNNKQAKPVYLDADEEVLDTISTKTNAWKITNKNVIKLTTKRELVEKIPISDLDVLDFYPGKMDAVYLYFETKQGDKELLKISGNTIFMAGLSGADPYEAIAKIYELIRESGNNPYPPYVDSDETILSTVRAGHSIMGLVNPAHVLKLTNKRLIDLKPQKQGHLEIDKTITLADVASTKVTKVQDNTSAYFEVKIKMNDNTKYKFVMDEKYTYAIRRIQDELAKFNG